MNMRTSQSKQLRDNETSGKVNQEAIIVWDQKGIVVMWQDGHRSRFSWQALRANCACGDCQGRELVTTVVERHAA